MARRKNAASKYYLQIAIGIFWLVFLFFVLGGGWGKWTAKNPEGTESGVAEESEADSAIGTTSGATALGSQSTTGSTETAPVTSAKNAVPNDGLTPIGIINSTLEQYGSATNYSDNAVLYLTYRLYDNPFKEQLRWSTHWDRNNRWWAELFDSQVHCDGKLLSCYVYDINSGNLDNQQLVLPVANAAASRAGSAIPVSALFQDRIASHFLQGFSRLALNKAILEDRTALAPPPIGLLTQQLSSPWLSRGAQFSRLADARIGERDCYVVRSEASIGAAEFWIDKKTNTFLQMNLPTSLLAGGVLDSPDVDGLRFFAIFHDAKLNGAASSKFAPVVPRKNATLVQRFVKIPDRLPTELLGEVAPTFDLLDAYAKPVRSQSFQGKATTLLWLAGNDPTAALKDMKTVKSRLGNDFDFAAIVSDESVERLANGGVQIAKPLLAASRETGIPVLYDPQLAATKLLRIDLVPTSQGQAVEKPIAVVMDSNSRIQFAKTVADGNWTTQLLDSIKLVASGQNVAMDVRKQYKSYLDGYNNDLEKVTAIGFFPGLKTNVAETSTPTVERVQDANLRLTPNLQWSSKAFRKPGNVLITENSRGKGKSIFVFDGWQTVKQLSANGDVVASHALDLPESDAVSLVRSGRLPSGQIVFAAFSKLGRQVHFYDQAWRRVGSFPTKDVKHKGIQDVQAYDINGTGADQFLICFDDEHGGHLVDPTTGKSAPYTSQNIGSAAPSGKRMAVVDQGKPGWIKDQFKSVDGEFNRIKSVGQGLSSRFSATGRTKDGGWMLTGFDQTLSKIWAVPVGSLFFTDETEPLAVTRSSRNVTLWAVADTANIVSLISGEGKWLGDFDATSKIHGVGLTSDAERMSLVVSTEKGVECWALNFDSKLFRKASTRN